MMGGLVNRAAVSGVCAATGIEDMSVKDEIVIRPKIAAPICGRRDESAKCRWSRPGSPGILPARSINLLRHAGETPGLPGYAGETPGLPGYAGETPGLPGYAGETPELPGYA